MSISNVSTSKELTEGDAVPDVQANQESIILQLSRSRSAAKANITKKMKELTEWQMTRGSVYEADEKLRTFVDVASKFYLAHSKYHSLIKDENDLADSEEYFEKEKKRIENFKSSFNDWVHRLENTVPFDQVNIQPSDSISNVGKGQRSSTASTRSKGGSSVASAKIAAKAKRAALEAERKELVKEQALEKERLLLEQRRRELDLNKQLAKIEAEERVYNEAMGGEYSTNVTQLPETKPHFLSGERFCAAKSTRPVHRMKTKQPTSNASSDVAEEFLRTVTDIQQQQQDQMHEMYKIQDRRDQQLQQMFSCHNQMAASLALPNVEVPVFSGDPVEYCHFLRSFENLIEAKTPSPSSRLFYLVQYTSGEVQHLMRSCLTMSPETGYVEAKRLLKEKYGQNYSIATAYVNRIISAPPVKSEDNLALQSFAVLLVSCRNALKEIGYLNKIENPDILLKIIEKLPFPMRQRWREVADDIPYNKSREIMFDDVVKFVEARARILNHPMFGKLTGDSRNKPRETPSSRSRQSFGIDGRSNSQEIQQKEKLFKCALCNGNHILARCCYFQKESVEGRKKIVRKRGLCDNCLLAGHTARFCSKNSFCKVAGCDRKHSTYLHSKSTPRLVYRAAGPDNVSKCESGLDAELGTNHSSAIVNASSVGRYSNGVGHLTTSLPLVPVKVKCLGSNQVIITYAFLDSGSNITFCTNELLDQLGVNGRETSLSLTTLQNEDSITKCHVVSLLVYDLDEESLVELPNVFTTDKIPVSESSIPRQEDIEKWPHLKNVQLKRISSTVSLLIGNDVSKALEPKEVIECPGKGPYAIRTVLGWTVNGPLERFEKDKHRVNFIRSDSNLSEQFQNFCDMEFNDSAYLGRTEMSKEDSRALSLIEDSVNLKEGHYEIALPWKKSPPTLPYNRPLAEHRLNLLKKRLQKDHDLLKKYSDNIDDLLAKGYATKVPECDLENPQQPLWYLPHHPVYNPNKPDKIRVVFDCAAKYQGSSLNDNLLQGPDLTNGLVGVLIRFREGPVAMLADVEAMFHQVRVAPLDTNALRFLWWPENDLSKEPEEFKMVVHIFGATSSPCVANFALQKTADDNKEFGRIVTDTVKRNFYVHDCLKAVRDEKEGVQICSKLPELLDMGGFHLRKWVSNSPHVMMSIPEEERSGSIKDLNFDQPKIERALGSHWDVIKDEFVFKVTIKPKQPTRRGLLSIVSSIYDPLGFTAPFILPAKILLQELCKDGLKWDDLIEPSHLQRWNNWLQELPKLEQLHVPRSMKPESWNDANANPTQLHTFADASQSGYGAVSYLRFSDQQGNINCSFVMAKSRVVPLKAITVPRLELTAAVVASRLDRMILKETDIPIESSFLWTDSSCVLGYLHNERKRFQTFVANRVATILETSSPAQWKLVPGKQNPADDASRGLSADALLNSKRWFAGPEFLWHSEEHWPKQPNNPCVCDDDPEVKQTHQTLLIKADTQDLMGEIFKRFSSWENLKKFVSWMLRYRANLRKTVGSKITKEERSLNFAVVPISVDEMRNAEMEIIKNVQKNHFHDELSRLVSISGESKKFLTVKKSSQLYRLDPIMEDGIIRVGGRLLNSPLAEESKHPIILPKESPVSQLIALHFHHISGHSGLEHVLSLIRQRFWITGARKMLKRILNRCVNCKRRQGSAGEQKMADLPEHRVTPDQPPFSYVGVDCFGPFLVKRGRSLVKRYGTLFTCLAIRAVHIEVIHSLDTNSFIHALRRFIARRGPPKVIRSDNATNFVGGEKEIRTAIKQWNQEKIHQSLLQHNIKWIFNPPFGSHFGGIWERCIRTIRKILSALLKQQHVDDECLMTIMCEVESIMNSRPLTKVSDDPRDLEALTPNHLLLLRPGTSLPPGVFCQSDSYSKRRWKQAQYLSNVFWRRWLKEYLPELQRRQKWLKPQRNFSPGDIVMIVEQSSPRSSWPLGRILKVQANPDDGYVRSVVLKTKDSVLKRPIDKIVLLETDT